MGVDFVHVQGLDGVDHLLQLLGVQGAGLREHQDLFAEGHQRGDGRDAGLRSELLLGFGVHLGEDNVRVLLGDCGVRGPELLARAAPFGPEIDKDDIVEFRDLGAVLLGRAAAASAWDRATWAWTSSMSRALTASTTCSSCCAFRAPGCENTRTFSRKAISVGIDVMPASAASCCSASVSTLEKTTSGCFSETAEYVGPNCLHGPHHSAQKSTRTMSLSSTVDANCSPVMSTVAMSQRYGSRRGMSPAFRCWHIRAGLQAGQAQACGAGRLAPGRALVSRHSWIHPGSSRSAGGAPNSRMISSWLTGLPLLRSRVAI